jgi:hypothetical protein
MRYFCAVLIAVHMRYFSGIYAVFFACGAVEGDAVLGCAFDASRFETVIITSTYLATRETAYVHYTGKSKRHNQTGSGYLIAFPPMPQIFTGVVAGFQKH